MGATVRASVTYSGNLASQTVTVPAGVVTSDFGIIILSWAASVANETSTMTATGWAAPPSPYAATGCANMGFAVIIRDGGQVAGDTIPVSWSISTRLAEIVAIWYDNSGQPIDVVSAVSTRGGTSSLVSALAGATTTGANDTLLAIMTERSTASGTTPSSWSGITFTQDFFHENTATSNTSTYVGHAAGPVTAGATGTSALTYTGGAASGNSGTVLLALKTAPSGSTASGSISLSGSATAQAPATSAGTVALSGAATGTGPGNVAAGTVSISGGSAAKAAAVAAGSITISGAAVAGTPSVVRCIFERDNTALRVSALLLNTLTMRLAVSTSISGGNVVSPTFSSSTGPDAQGYVTNVAVSGLSSGTAYYYQIELNGTLVGTAVPVRTATAIGTAVNSFDVFGSCVQNGGTFGSTIPNPDSFKSIAARVSGVTGRIADYFSPLGDKIYDWNAASPNGDYMPAVAATIRAAIERGFGGANLRGIHSTISTQDGWSDNDSFGGNSDAGLNGGVPYWPASDGTSLSVWKQLLVYPTLPDANANYRSKGDGGVLRIWTDTRSYSVGATTTDNSTKTKLGFTQRAWLLNLFATARGLGYRRIIWYCDDLWVDTGGTSTSGNAGLPTQNDGWGAYGNERGVIAAAIVAAGWGNKDLLFACGDTHSILMDDGTHNAYGGFPIFCCAPFYQSATPNGTGLTFNVASYPSSTQAGMYYGTIEIADAAGIMTTTCTAWDATLSGGVPASDVQRGQMSFTSITAAGSISITGSASAKAVAAASGSISLSGSASTVSAPATGSITLTGAATAKVAAVAAGAIAVSGSVGGGVAVVASGAVNLAGGSSAAAAVLASGTIALTGAAVAAATALASGAITLTGAALAAVRAAASGTIALTGTSAATGPGNFPTGSITISGSAAAQSSSPATAAGTISLSGSALARAVAAVAGSVTVTGSATAAGLGPNTASGTVSLTGSATYRVPVTAGGTITITGFVGSAVARTPQVELSNSGDRWALHVEIIEGDGFMPRLFAPGSVLGGAEVQVINVSGGGVEYTYPFTITEITGLDISGDVTKAIVCAYGATPAVGDYVTPDVITRGTITVAAYEAANACEPTLDIPAGVTTLHFVTVQMLCSLATGLGNKQLKVELFDTPETILRTSPVSLQLV